MVQLSFMMSMKCYSTNIYEYKHEYNPGHFYTLLNTLYKDVHSSPVHIQIDIHSRDLQDEIFTEYEM